MSLRRRRGPGPGSGSTRARRTLERTEAGADDGAAGQQARRRCYEPDDLPGRAVEPPAKAARTASKLSRFSASSRRSEPRTARPSPRVDATCRASSGRKSPRSHGAACRALMQLNGRAVAETAPLVLGRNTSGSGPPSVRVSLRTRGSVHRRWRDAGLRAKRNSLARRAKAVRWALCQTAVGRSSGGRGRPCAPCIC